MVSPQDRHNNQSRTWHWILSPSTARPCCIRAGRRSRLKQKYSLRNEVLLLMHLSLRSWKPNGHVRMGFEERSPPVEDDDLDVDWAGFSPGAEGKELNRFGVSGGMGGMIPPLAALAAFAMLAA